MLPILLSSGVRVPHIQLQVDDAQDSLDYDMKIERKFRPYEVRLKDLLFSGILDYPQLPTCTHGETAYTHTHTYL